MAGFMEFLGAMAEAAVEAMTAKNTRFTAEELEALKKAEEVLRKHNFTEKADGIRLTDLIIEANNTATFNPTTKKPSKYETIEIVKDAFKRKGYNEYYSNIYECKYLNSLGNNIIIRFIETCDESIHIIAGTSIMVISGNTLENMRCVDVEINNGHIIASRYRGLSGTTGVNIEKRIMPIIKEALNKIN